MVFRRSYRRVHGLLWMVRRYGLRTTWRYECARAAGVTIDYAQVFTADERALLAEHFTMPWETPPRQAAHKQNARDVL